MKETLSKVELSASSYDTAWVAMVPSHQDSEHKPLFPNCLDWVMKHQHPDGSWCVDPCHALLAKDSLSSTLACVLALNKWKAGELLVKRGLEYIETNSWAITDKNQLSPIGFDIIFPGMIKHAIEGGLKLPLDPVLVDSLLQKHDNEVGRYDLEGNKGDLAYVLEGLDRKIDWKAAMKHQRSNGSILNSPSATAAALIHKHDDNCYNYLSSLLKKYDEAVPTAYPLDIYIQLSMIDNLKTLGIDQYFESETKSILDNVYGLWQQRDEEIFSDINCCALGFRILRMSRYDVSSDYLAQFSEQKHFFNSVSPQFKNTSTILELHKASKTMICQKEPILEEIKAWTSSFLKQELLSGAIQDKRMHEEVNHFLRYSYANLDRLESRRRIEQCNVDNMKLLKTSYRSPNINNRDFWELSVQDYNMCQATHLEDLEHLERWYKDSRLEQLKFPRQVLISCYFSSASILPQPQFSDARIAMTKNCVLATIVDDFFDVAGSMEELGNMIELIERWEGGEGNSAVGFCSEQVYILFSAFQDMINEIGSMALIRQGRNVKPHLIKIWRNLLNSTNKEARWAREKQTPTLNEYMENAYISFGVVPILVPMYVIGPRMSEEVVESAEYAELYKLASTVGRLLNDLVSVEREGAQGKLNSVSIRVLHGHGTITEEDAKKKIKGLIENYSRELLRMVLQTEGSVVPQACKDYVWQHCSLVHYFYKEDDGFTAMQHQHKDVEAVLWEPIILPQ